MNESKNTIELTGLDGSNPLAFLAALGTLYLLNRMSGAVRTFGMSRLSWASPSLAPSLHFDSGVNADALVQNLTHCVRSHFANGQRPYFLYNDIIAIEPDKFRSVIDRSIGNHDEAVIDLLSGFGTDAVVQTGGKKAGCIEPSEISFSNGQSMRYLLDAYSELVNGLTTKSSTYAPVDAGKIKEALFSPWTYTDHHKELRWDPTELRLGAMPSQARGTVVGANVLAFWSFAMLRSMPTSNGLQTTAVHRISGAKRRRTYFLMPQWRYPAAFEVVRTLMESDLLRLYAITSRRLRASSVLSNDDKELDRKHATTAAHLNAQGITHVFACEIITEMKANYFAPSFEL
ncbi:MAG: hypothetical protein QM754_17555 [Tepidisphaeraceae bacterium]